MRIILKISKFLAMLSLALAVALLIFDYLKTFNAFPSRTFISVVDVSELTPEEAIQRLRRVPLALLYTPTLTLQVEEKKLSFSPEQLGIHVLYKETIKRAFAITHKMNYFDAFKERREKESFFAPVVLGLDESRLRAVLEVFARKLYTPSREATFAFYEKSGGFHIEPEVIGKELNLLASLENFKEAVSKKERLIRLSIDYLEPRVTEKQLRAHPPAYRLSTYTTYYGTHDSKNRIHNIKLIASWISGKLLMPGEVFSLEESVGEFLPERGFKEAFVIYDGELVPELGGGTCQVGTTLYNAASLADLKIVQRRNHSFYFNIYPLGRDATLYPKLTDFKFENDTDFPLIIKAVATDKRLSIRLYGTPTGKKVKFSDPEIFGKDPSGKFIPMTIEEVLEKDVPFRTKITRTVYDKKWKKIKEDVIHSYYKLYGDKENVPIRRPEPG